MRNSPYMPQSGGKNEFRTRLGFEPIPGNRAIARAGSREPIVASSGAINASSKRDLMLQIAALIQKSESGEIQRYRAPSQAESAIVDARNQILLAAAQGDPEAFMAVGEILGDEIRLAMNREGFTRRLLLYKNLKQGEIGRLRVRQKDVTAWYVTQNSTVVASQVRQPWLFPKDFYLIGRILIEDMEIQSSTGDLLQEKLDDGLEQIMVQEDRVFLNLADHAATTVNDHYVFTSFSPKIFAQMKHEINENDVTYGMAA